MEAFQSSSVSNDALVGLHNRAQELRDLFLSDVQALVRRGAIPAPQVAEFKGAVGYKNVGFELLGLAGVLRQHWAQIQGRTGVAAAELDEAERLGQQLLKAAGEREQAPSVATEVAQIRQRAFTLFMRTYDAARRAINFLRWEQDDADSIIPPLYPGRPRKSSKPAPAEAGKPPVVTPVAPVAPGLPGGSPFLS